VCNGFPSGSALDQRVRAFQCFHETLKCSRALPGKWVMAFPAEMRNFKVLERQGNDKRELK
jgi:hypothetical protein